MSTNNGLLAPVLEQIAALTARVDKLTAALAELHTVRLPEKRGAEALAETERRCLIDDIAAMAQQFDTPEDHQGSRHSPHAMQPRPGLDASPEVGEGDAPQGLTREQIEESIRTSRELEECILGASVNPVDGSVMTWRSSATYCAICDGDALPAVVRLKGGGFVCEGCVAP